MGNFDYMTLSETSALQFLIFKDVVDTGKSDEYLIVKSVWDYDPAPLVTVNF